MASPAYEGSRLPTSPAGEGEIVDDVFEGRLETTIQMRIGEAKCLPAALGGRPRDMFIKVCLDQEEMYRTAVIEKTLSPLFTESFSFLVPHPFSRLTFYLCDADCTVLRDQRFGQVNLTAESLASGYEVGKEQWLPIRAVTANSEVQGKVLVRINVMEQLEGGSTVPVLCVRVCECSGLASWSLVGAHSDPFYTVTLFSMSMEQRSEVRRSTIKKRTLNPVFDESFIFKLGSLEELSDCLVRVAIWHQQLLGEDTFLGEVHLSVGALSTSRSHEAWYTLSSHWEEQEEASTSVIGSLRLLVSYHEDLIHSMSMYEPLKQLLLDGLVEEEFTNSSLNILYEVCKDRSTLGACIVKIFLQLGKFDVLAQRLIDVDLQNTTDPNTLFRGNSLASKVIDEFMKTEGQTYLHRTLQPCVDEIFEVKRSCEIDHSRLTDAENLDVNMTNLLFFVEKVLSAITSSARSCPPLMVRVFTMLRQSAVSRFPEHKEEVAYTAVSAFIFLRFFAPAILNPKLFGLRPENPSPIVSRSLLLISKTVQNLGNIGARQRTQCLRKEDYMVPLLAELMDAAHIKTINDYLDLISCSDTLQWEQLERSITSVVYREGYLVKRALARKKFGVKNFKKRYFVLTDNGLSYSKSRVETPIHCIPVTDMLAVERVDESAFSMKFMMQLVQPERILYMQAKNSVDQIEWLSSLAKLCYRNRGQPRLKTVHSGAFISNCWTCCHHQLQDQPGCQPISTAVQLLGHNEELDLGRELNKLYRLVIEGQEGLMSLKDQASQSTRQSGSHLEATLPPRLKVICELLIFVKNLEFTSKSQIKRKSRLGSRDAPYVSISGEACVLK